MSHTFDKKKRGRMVRRGWNNDVCVPLARIGRSKSWGGNRRSLRWLLIRRFFVVTQVTKYLWAVVRIYNYELWTWKYPGSINKISISYSSSLLKLSSSNPFEFPISGGRESWKWIIPRNKRGNVRVIIITTKPLSFLRHRGAYGTEKIETIQRDFGIMLTAVPV